MLQQARWDFLSCWESKGITLYRKIGPPTPSLSPRGRGSRPRLPHVAIPFEARRFAPRLIPMALNSDS